MLTKYAKMNIPQCPFTKSLKGENAASLLHQDCVAKGMWVNNSKTAKTWLVATRFPKWVLVTLKEVRRKQWQKTKAWQKKKKKRNQSLAENDMFIYINT